MQVEQAGQRTRRLLGAVHVQGDVVAIDTADHLDRTHDSVHRREVGSEHAEQHVVAALGDGVELV